MSEVPAPQDAAGALQAALAALRREGVWRIDPVRFHWLEAVARRLPGQPEAVRRLLQARLEAAVADYAARAAQAREAAGDPPGLQRGTAQAPSAAAGAPLAQLNRYIRTKTAREPDAAQGQEQHDELASVRRFRRAWSTSRSQRQVAQAALRKPANAGPLNSHALVLDALEAMRELSPDYLRRFISHVESLQWLEQAAPARPPPPRHPPPAPPAPPPRPPPRPPGKQ